MNRNIFHGMKRRADWWEHEASSNRTDFIVLVLFLVILVASNGVVRGL